MSYPDQRPIKRGAEPIFTIRAQDALAVPSLIAYRDICTDHGLLDQADKVQDRIQEFMGWQRENEKHTHLPKYKGGAKEHV